jgi:hypothetical protein
MPNISELGAISSRLNARILHLENWFPRRAAKSKFVTGPATGRITYPNKRNICENYAEDDAR